MAHENVELFQVVDKSEQSLIKGGSYGTTAELHSNVFAVSFVSTDWNISVVDADRGNATPGTDDIKGQAQSVRVADDFHGGVGATAIGSLFDD